MNDDPRPKWWKIVVSIMFIVITTIMVTLFFVVPDQMFLDGDTIANEHQRAVFRSVARSNACGDTLAIVVCVFLIRTQQLSVIHVCTISLTVWMSLENVMVPVEYFTSGQLSDPVGNIIDFIDLLLMLYMLVRLRKFPSGGGPVEETASLTA